MRRSTAPAKPVPAKGVTDTRVDPLQTFLEGRPGWSQDDAAVWCYEPRAIRITTAGPGHMSRLSCSVGGSKPVTFATRTGVECWVAAAGA
jgi:hypothetical protein